MEGRGLKSDPGWGWLLLTGNFPLPPLSLSALFSSLSSLFSSVLKCALVDAPHYAHAQTLFGDRAALTVEFFSHPRINFGAKSLFPLSTITGCDDGDCFVPARLRVGVPGQLGSRLFGIQRSDGPESSQQTQVETWTSRTNFWSDLQVIRTSFSVTVVPKQGPTFFTGR